MIRRLVDFALNTRLLVVLGGLILLIAGAISFHNLPVEAYPDVANTYVQIITQWPGHAAEEIEQQVSIPIETAVSGVPNTANLRSISVFGLSVVTLIFEDGTDTNFARQQVNEKIGGMTLTNNLQPQLGPNYSPVGQVYWYTLKSTNPQYDLMELKSLQDWYISKQLKSVPGVADVSSFGGATREYQVQVDPNRLVSYGLSISQVEQALANNNTNAGGSFISHGEQAFNIRAVGLLKDVSDIRQTVLKSQNGVPIRVSDIGDVVEGTKIRLGQIGKAILRKNHEVVDNDDLVEGMVLLRKGADTDGVVKLIHEKVTELNGTLLPPGVKIVSHLDRSELVHFTTHTVLHNLTEGIVLVVVILFLFLGNIRGALIVAITIPFSLLFASICLDLNKVPANLLSLGALDFGMVVDGAVVMIENILRHAGKQDERRLTMMEKIRRAAHEVQRPVFYAIGIIITAYLPIFTLQRVEGRLFRPMALTVAFALFGALIFSLVLAPVLASFLFRKSAREWHNPVLEALIRGYRSSLGWSLSRPWVPVLGVLLLMIPSFYLAASGRVGSEFLPHLDEGAIWARGTLAPSTGPEEGERIVDQGRQIFASFPEVRQVVSQVGRPDDGTDVTGFFNTEYYIDLLPKEEWRPIFHEDKDRLIAAMGRAVEHIPGTLWNFSQPISDNMEEAVSGVKGELAVKIFGTDLKTLEQKADEIVGVMRNIPGIADLGVFRVIGQPNVNFVINRELAARFGINVSDIQDAVEAAVGGKAVSQVLQGERRYDLVVRYQPQFRSTVEEISDVRLLAPSGERVSLGQLCDLKIEDGASQIYRENNSRYIALKYSVRGRDLGSTVEQAIEAVKKQVKLPVGYTTTWAGEYESANRANRRLMIIVPVTIALIFLLLYSASQSFKWATLILVTILLAPVGGIYALWLTGTHFSVSSGVGFLALFGVCVQTGVIMIAYINQLRARGVPIREAALRGAVMRLRPIMMTMLVATLGLLPAAHSRGIGSDSQRPFAIVIVGGLCATLLMSVYLLPTLYVWIARPTDKLPDPEGDMEDTEHVEPAASETPEEVLA